MTIITLHALVDDSRFEIHINSDAIDSFNGMGPAHTQLVMRNGASIIIDENVENVMHAIGGEQCALA